MTLILGSIYPLLAQSVDLEEPIDQIKKNKINKIKPTILPILFYSPETQVAIGATGLLLFKTNDTNARTSYIDFFALTTQRKQRIIASLWSVFTPKEKFFIKGELYYSKFPDYFYGIGNQTSEEMREEIRYKTFFVYNWCLRQLRPHLFFGPQYQLYKVFDTRFPLYSRFNESNLKSFNGSLTSGLGLAFVFDTRDHTTNAHTGWYIEASGYEYANFLGSQYNFTSVLLDIRKYIPINSNATLALAVANNINVGEAPFKQLAFLGGTRNMRGYYEGRYRDNNSIIFQAEFRQKVYKRWGVVVFATAGNVYSNIDDLIHSTIRYTLGTGIRFAVNRKENTNLRLDAGFGEHTHGIYGNFTEAF